MHSGNSKVKRKKAGIPSLSWRLQSRRKLVTDCAGILPKDIEHWSFETTACRNMEFASFFGVGRMVTGGEELFAQKQKHSGNQRDKRVGPCSLFFLNKRCWTSTLGTLIFSICRFSVALDNDGYWQSFPRKPFLGERQKAGNFHFFKFFVFFQLDSDGTRQWWDLTGNRENRIFGHRKFKILFVNHFCSFQYGSIVPDSDGTLTEITTSV